MALAGFFLPSLLEFEALITEDGKCKGCALSVGGRARRTVHLLLQQCFYSLRLKVPKYRYGIFIAEVTAPGKKRWLLWEEVFKNES